MIVQTKNGKIRGVENVSPVGDKKYHSFLGVPYAKPPIGDLRFSAPEPLEIWDDVYDATYERDQCAQLDMIKTGNNFEGSDDCLYLNIHTPGVNLASLKPVLFYIHGGGFFCGSGTVKIHGGDYLMKHDVILVTINYRLNILGYLNLQIPECPGNAGMKDQVAALKWVKENITAFGGDPNNITIGGCSAGGSSVNLLMISPLANGLFQKAIAQCGTALSCWTITDDPIKWAFQAGKKLGFTGEDRLDLLKFLRTIPARELAKTAQEIFGEVQQAFSARALYCPFSPSVEAIKQGAFLPDSLENLLKTATPLPTIFGHNGVEPIYLSQYLSETLAKDPKSALPQIVTSNFKGTSEQLKRIEGELRKFYLEDNDSKKSDLEKINELLTDIITLPTYDSFEFVIRSNTPAYVYYFTYYTENSYFRKKPVAGLPPYIKKGTHGEEQAFVLYGNLDDTTPPYLNGKDGEVREKMTQLWANFVKTGDPSSENVDVKWKPSTMNEPCYLEINMPFVLNDGRINEKRINFLKNILHDVEMNK